MVFGLVLVDLKVWQVVERLFKYLFVPIEVSTPPQTHFVCTGYRHDHARHMAQVVDVIAIGRRSDDDVNGTRQWLAGANYVLRCSVECRLVRIGIGVDLALSSIEVFTLLFNGASALNKLEWHIRKAQGIVHYHAQVRDQGVQLSE